MARVFLWCCAVVFLGLAVALLGWPAEILSKVDLKFETPTAFADIRADYGGCILGVGLFMAWCAMAVDRVRIGLLCCALTLGGYAVGRLLSLFLDGTPKQIIFILLFVEIVGSAACFFMMTKTNPPTTQTTTDD